MIKLTNDHSPVKVQLSRNLVRQIKRGHAWVYGDALRSLPKVPPGTPAILLDNRGGKEIARGYLDPEGAIALRVCTTAQGENLDHRWAESRFSAALALREELFAPYQQTSGFRLFNGEGDGLPGLVCDIYDQTAILITDGPARRPSGRPTGSPNGWAITGYPGRFPQEPGRLREAGRPDLGRTGQTAGQFPRKWVEIQRRSGRGAEIRLLPRPAKQPPPDRAALRG